MQITILLLIPVFNIVCNATKPDNSSRKNLESEVKTEVWPTSHSTSSAPVQPSHQEPMSRSLAQSALKPSLSFVSDGTKIKTMTPLPMVFCMLNRKTYRDICHPQNVPQSQKKIKTISHSGRGGRERKIPQINEAEELLLLLTLPDMRNILISHLFPKCHEGRKNGFEASLIRRLDYSRPRKESHESLSLLIVTPHLLFFLPALPPHPDGIKGFEVSQCFATQCAYSLYALWKSHQYLELFCFPKNSLKLKKIMLRWQFNDFVKLAKILEMQNLLSLVLL